ncbi:FadR/GntR family transcriptional regulator [Anaerosacchariphilus polymeriproducens]|uniref:FadR family transcriptional regulator n=1 Tax=Anaerosacchariphilus polymeriproducens TaxID=1812858 RepID=A0A371B082_9FIRM|nr:FadR/GntR family transcriptional regulator [Anaerosacchariphilus polymeriproducens]RDU25278.1 FadR family transcriptional regulator [Anaerosacchariphilus polymeriproducens]
MGIVKKSSSSEQIIDYILKKIEDQEWKSGDRLPSEREFAQQLGVSRIPLREAICALSTMGILSVKQGGGTFIEEYNPEYLGKNFKTYTLLSKSLIDEIFEARIILEAEVAKLAARNRKDDDLKGIRQAMRRHSKTALMFFDGIGTKQEVLLDDNDFHMGIAAATHNSFLYQMLDTVRSVGQNSHLYDDKYVMNREEYKEAIQFHEKIYQAIAEQKEDIAFSVMENHIKTIRSSLDVERMKKEFGEE